MAAIHNIERANVEVNRMPETSPVDIGLISDNYLDVLGVRTILGRVPRSGEPTPAATITYGYWESRFGRDPRVLGSTVGINGTVFSIVGVTAPGFSGDLVGKAVNVWIPLAMQSVVMLDRPQHHSAIRLPWRRAGHARIASADTGSHVAEDG